MTELEAINSMLEIIGQAPVTSVDTSRTEVKVAQNILVRMRKQVLVEGFHFNVDYKKQLTRNVDNKILVPQDTLSIDNTYGSYDVVPRDGYLYDLIKHTNIFSENLYVDRVFDVTNFEEIPQHIADYIAVKAGRKFQSRFLRDRTSHVLTEQDELDARVALDLKESETRDYSVFDNRSSQRIIHRVGNIRK